MSAHHRIGVDISKDDWYWAQVLAGIGQAAQAHHVELVDLNAINFDLATLPGEALITWLEQQPPGSIDALLCTALVSHSLQTPKWYRLLDRHLPIITLTESALRHPLLISPCGFDEMAYALGTYVVELLHGRGTILVVGGLSDSGEAGRSRLAGLQRAFQGHPDLHVHHVPSLWSYTLAYAQVYPALLRLNRPVDAIIGLLDPLALAARDAAAALDLLSAHTYVVGCGNYPFARTALASGIMTATVDLAPARFGSQALALAVHALQQPASPAQLPYTWQIITSDRLAVSPVQEPVSLPATTDLAAEAMLSPTLSTDEIIQAIDYLHSTILERRQLLHGIARLLRANYGYDDVHVLRWLPAQQVFVLEYWPADATPDLNLPLREAPVFAHVVCHPEPLFLLDALHNEYFAPDPCWPETRTRFILPLRLGGTLVGLLDLHSYTVRPHTMEDFSRLKYILIRIALCLQSTELYQEKIEAQKRAEQADQFKTRLLANVSHELRFPLHAILNYTQLALTKQRDQQGSHLHHVIHHTHHLERLVSDLLDLASAEIGSLPIVPELLATHAFLSAVFHDIVEQHSPTSKVRWELLLPTYLPLIEADPVRLRQIVLNLLDNASKYTRQGRIVLGAEVTLAGLHLWVQDTGCGITPEQQEHIFEPFVTAEQPMRQRRVGIGLGLAITRHIVALHHGQMTLESSLNVGSTFHIYLPLLTLSHLPHTPQTATQPGLLLVAAHDQLASTIDDLCRRLHLTPQQIPPEPDLDALWQQLRPCMIVWDTTAQTAEELHLIQRLRSHSSLQMLPFVVFNHNQEELTPTLLHLLTNPVGQALQLTLNNPPMQVPTLEEGTILIVDDDEQFCVFTRQLIAETFPTYHVDSVSNGYEALRYLTTALPSLVLLDMVLPGIDGFLLLNHLRVNPHTSKVPVLVLSSYPLSAEDVQRLNYPRVVFQRKDLLTRAELSSLLQRLQAGLTLTPQTSLLIKQFILYLQQYYMHNLTLEEMAQAIGVSKRHLSRIVLQELGMPPKEYVNRYRLQKAQELLRTSTASINIIAKQIGFTDPNYFRRLFQQHTGLTPGEYRKQRA